MSNILKKAAKDLQCTFRNNNSIDLDNATGLQVLDWLKSNGFTQSKVRKGRWIKPGFEIIFDSIGGFLYEPQL